MQVSSKLVGRTRLERENITVINTVVRKSKWY